MTYLINGLNGRAGLRGNGPVGTYHVHGLGVDKEVLKVAKAVAAGTATQQQLANEKAISASFVAKQAAWDTAATTIRSTFKLPASGPERTIALQLREAAVTKALGARPVRPSVNVSTSGPLPGAATADGQFLPALDTGGGVLPGGGGGFGGGGSNTLLYVGGAAVVLAFLAMRR